MGPGVSLQGLIDAGEFIAAASGKPRYIFRGALQAEAEAGVAASEGASALGLHQRVIFECVSKTLADAPKTNGHALLVLSPIGVLLRKFEAIV
jgi:hypothetical protein